MEIIIGKVQKGRGIGKTIDFPTINLPYFGETRGVFVGKVFLTPNEDNFQEAAVHIGNRPTFFDEEIVCEAYLIDYEGGVETGTEVKIEIYDKIREIKKFENLLSLKKQITEDVEFVRNWYNLQKKENI